MDYIRILIIDDHPMMREALVTALEDEPNIEVIGEANNGVDALKLAVELKPDVILMDLLMPGMGGVEAIAKLQENHPHIKVMVVSSLEDEEKILAAVQAGALGYFPKTAPRTYLLEAIQKVADGVPYLPAGIAAKLFKGIRELKFPLTGRSAADEPLTARQEEVLALIGEGKSDEEISEILHLAETTVRSHVHHIIRRLGVKNRTQAVAYINRLRRDGE
ncbi:MAG: response regulator transcription factor [Chloroflexi bacterium]|nr:response regulator transcription factor [Chloroflexota bacterium]